MLRSNEFRLLSSIISTLCVARATADLDEEHRPPSFVAQFFHGKHVRTVPQLHPSWYEHESGDDEDDYKPLLDTSEFEDDDDDDEGRTNSTSSVRHSSKQQTGYDSDEDDRDTRRRNNFLIHRAKKQQRAKNDDERRRFVWRPFTPSFLINFEPYAPVSPLLLSKWSRKPNDILLVVLQQQQQSAPPTPSAASCTCGSSRNNETSAATSSDDLRKERNESSSSSSSSSSVLDEPHLTLDWPSSCIFAIVACCSPNNYHFRYGCFPYLGCSIAFWDTEPCQLSIMIEASKHAHTYYSQLAVHEDGGAEGKEKPHPDTENYPAGGEGGFQGAGGEGDVQSSTTSAGTPSTSTTTTSPVTTTTTTTTTTSAAPTTSPIPDEPATAATK